MVRASSTLEEMECKGSTVTEHNTSRLYETTTEMHSEAIHWLATCLQAVADWSIIAEDLGKERLQQVSWVCRLIGGTDFSSLSTRYHKVARDLVLISKGGYLDWTLDVFNNLD